MSRRPVVGGMATRRRLLGALGVAVLGGCLGDEDGIEGGGDAGISLRSSAFDAEASIPTKYTCEGEDVSPPLRILEAPDGAESLALVLDDPDAPTEDPFVHWLIWNVPPGTAEMPEGVAREERVEVLGDAHQGTNDFDDVGYRGPCPPEGDDAHTYRFMLRALETELDLEAGARRSALEGAIAGSVVDETTLTGTYQR